MIRLMETAAFHALQPYCEGDEITVGTSIQIVHRAASGVGARVKAEAVLESFDGRFYTLRVTARDDVQEIGRGTVGRAVARIGKVWEKVECNVFDACAVGMNFEDATGDSDSPLTELTLQLERLRAIRETAEELRVPIVLNARTDVYLLQIGDPSRRYDEAVRRLSAFRDAGADCVFAPGVRDAETIGRFVTDLKCPVNILGVPCSPSVPELVKLGVKRISLGSGPMRSSLGFLRKLAEEVKTSGTCKLMEGAPSHAEMNKLMSGNRVLNR